MVRAMTRILFSLLGVLVWASVTAQAQQNMPELPTQSPISIGQVVEDSITNGAIFDLWSFSALQGDRYRVVMTASGGLAPLVGVRTSGGEVFARSDISEDGAQADALPDSIAVLEFEILEDGEYFLIATRARLAEGTTSGRYSLSMTFADDSQPDPRENLLQPVTFRCGSDIATTAATLAFDEDRQTMQTVRISVYGIDGFAPVLQLGRDELAECLEPIAAEAIPQSISLTLGDGETLEAAQLNTATYEINAARPVYLTLGTRGEFIGRYVIVIEGFAIDQADDRDALFLRLGPRVTDGDFTVYMMNNGRSRIDPTIDVLREESAEPLAQCDDAGRFACADVPTAVGYRLIVDDTTLSGGRLDAGVIVAPDDDLPTAVIFSSSNSASGVYTIWVEGGIP